jgi:hypothetical protein
MTDRNAAQEIADDMITDPDKDAEGKPPPTPPQTIDAEPTQVGPADDHGDER